MKNINSNAPVQCSKSITFGVYAIHNWTLTETDGNTIVKVDESMEGILARLFRKSFNKNLEKGMQRWLDLLKLECESREDD